MTDRFTLAVACAAMSGLWRRDARTGSAFVIASTAASIMEPCCFAAVFPQDAVTIAGETGEFAGRLFCPRCGSSVFSRNADEVEVHLGSLDAPDQLRPTYECWTVRRESRLPPFPLTRRYDRDREATGRLEE